MPSGSQRSMTHEVQAELRSIERQIPQAKYPDFKLFNESLKRLRKIFDGKLRNKNCRGRKSLGTSLALQYHAGLVAYR